MAAKAGRGELRIQPGLTATITGQAGKGDPEQSGSSGSLGLVGSWAAGVQASEASLTLFGEQGGWSEANSASSPGPQ